MIGQPAFRGTRVFTTEGTENTEGQRRKASCCSEKTASSASPLCSLCLCCETVFRRFSARQTHVKLALVKRIECEDRPGHVTAWTRTPQVSSESAARASAETAERQPVVPIRGACQPVVRGLVSRHREIDLYASTYRCMPTAPGAQPPFRERRPAAASGACGEYTFTTARKSPTMPRVIGTPSMVFAPQLSAARTSGRGSRGR